jgi:hypothetical protein
MNSDFEIALDHCLNRLCQGDNLQSCLERYPRHAEELRPLLEVALDLGRVATPPPAMAVRAAGKQRMLRAVEKRAAQPVSKSFLSRYAEQIINTLLGKEPQNMKLAWRFVTVIVVAALGLTSVATVAASADSLPGDLLYPVKTTVQKAKIALTLNAETREELKEEINAERREEVRAVLQAQREAKVEFQGALQRIEGDTWIVGGLPVLLQVDTVVEGVPQLGARVSVEGRLPGDGTIVAVELTVGEPLPGPFDSPLATPEAQETDEPDETETPESDETETPESDETETPEPDETETPESDETETPESDETETPEPDETETPEPDETETPEAKETEEPDDDDDSDDSDGPKETETPEPEETDEPDDDDDDSDGPEETATPAPTQAPEPTSTPEPTETREPTETPEPKATDAPDASDADDSDDDDSDDEEDETEEPEEDSTS